MKFRYEKQVDFRDPQLPWKSRPIIKVRLSFGDQHQSVFSLIDSGADVTIFHISIAKTLGIDLTGAKAGHAVGISGEPIRVYYQTIKLQLDGSDSPIELEAGFIDSPGVGALLGQNGFFDHFRICFERNKDEIEIRPNRQS